jgi:hypothetical protein
MIYFLQLTEENRQILDAAIKENDRLFKLASYNFQTLAPLVEHEELLRLGQEVDYFRDIGSWLVGFRSEPKYPAKDFYDLLTLYRNKTTEQIDRLLDAMSVTGKPQKKARQFTTIYTAKIGTSSLLKENLRQNVPEFPQQAAKGKRTPPQQ